ncbi:HET-domain-containing protein, partial [Plenodomus tracheiphilus IPT5]
MRLLDTQTLELRSFTDYVPPYAILSHCWEEEEVSFADLSNLEAARLKKGFLKVQRACERAVKDNYDYLWIDSCAIDKSSSAELSEAINSMFVWYRGARMCYIYLADVDGPSDLSKSRWFTRAWTLQELLAPCRFRDAWKSRIKFLDRNWQVLSNETTSSKVLSEITGIPQECFDGIGLYDASISMRMSWAAGRQATRPEDIAYALLGIFDVNMPLLYGEGKIK